MLRILIILILSTFLLSSCSKKNVTKKDTVLNSGNAIVVDGKVKEKGCKLFDFYCKRTGQILDPSGKSNQPEPTEEERAISMYYEAVEALNLGDAFYAQRKFKEVEGMMPKDTWASKASLMAGYADYTRSAYSGAIFTLERHMKHYPADKNMSYVHYLVAMCHYEQILDEKKDLKPLLKAKKKFEFIVQVYPDTDYAMDARFKLDLIIDQLAAKEMSIARYYMKTQKWIPALNRLKVVIDKYEKTIFVEEALHRLVEVYYKLGLTDEAKRAAAILGYNYQSGDWYKRSYKVFNKEYKSNRIENKKETGFLRSKIKGLFE